MGNPPLQPDFQAALTTLLDLFLAFTRARSERQRRDLESQILSIFDRLGATSNQLVMEARTRFETLRDESGASKMAATWGIRAKSTVNARIKQFEAPRNLRLTKWAKDMLRIPMIEIASINEGFSEEQVEKSVDRILQTMEGQNIPQEEVPTRTSIDVIRAFHQNFCNIPPFCSGKGNG